MRQTVETLDPQGILYRKTRDHDKVFTALIVLESLQKYVLYEYHTSLGHNGTPRLYQCLNRKYYLKGLRKSVHKLVRNFSKCQTKTLQAPNYTCLYLEVPQMMMNFTSIDLIGPFQIIPRGNWYDLTVICILIN